MPGPNLPVTDYLKDLAGCPPTESSPIAVVRGFGPHFARQAFQVCGTCELGGILEHFSGLQPHQLDEGIRLVCRNRRAGEQGIPELSRMTTPNFLKLLKLGRDRPELFPSYNVNIHDPLRLIDQMMLQLLNEAGT